MKTYKSLDELIGGTPLLELTRIERELGLSAHVFAKLERFNPTGSAKDRAALQIISQAEKDGILCADGGIPTIIEPTSGNTGIGIAAIAAARGYRAIIVMPDSMSRERQLLMKAYGAELVLTPGADGMKGAIEKAESLHAEIPGSIIAGQFTNPANAQAHYLSTGPEIYDDLDGKVDMFIAGIGTGGTITGTGRYLKEKLGEAVQVIGIEPALSPLITQGKAGAHDLQGIGANFIPKILDMSVIDSVETVTNEQAYEGGRILASREGILCGITSGAALSLAIRLASLPENTGKNIVILLPDTGERYLSTKMFE